MTSQATVEKIGFLSIASVLLVCQIGRISAAPFEEPTKDQANDSTLENIVTLSSVGFEKESPQLGMDPADYVLDEKEFQRLLLRLQREAEEELMASLRTLSPVDQSTIASIISPSPVQHIEPQPITVMQISENLDNLRDPGLDPTWTNSGGTSTFTNSLKDYDNDDAQKD